MAAHRDATTHPLKTYACESCGRLFVAAGEIAKDEGLRCACGATLRAAALGAGMYEATPCSLGVVEIETHQPSPDAGAQPAGRTGESEEADLGYGKSHGYGPSHGGPTGPGDAPAGETDVGSK